MTNNNQKDEPQKGGVSPVVAAVAGAVVGAGVAVAGTMAMQDEKNREKVKEVLGNVKDQAVGYMEKMQSEGEDKLAEGQKTAKAVSDSAKKSLQNGVKDAKKAAGK